MLTDRTVKAAAGSLIAAWLMGVAFVITFWLGVIYVAWHFISKYW